MCFRYSVTIRRFDLLFESISMSKHATMIDMSDLPVELQWQILDRLEQEDHMAMHQTSRSWRNMLIGYLSSKNAIRPADWRWFCRHCPQKTGCSECLIKLQNKVDKIHLAKDWNWWL